MEESFQFFSNIIGSGYPPPMKRTRNRLSSTARITDKDFAFEIYERLSILITIMMK